MLANCKNCKTKFEQKIFNYRYCEKTESCKIAGAENKNYLIQKAIQKAKIKTEKKKRDETKNLKDSITNWGKELQTEINKICRLIDKDQLCLARNQRGQMHAGHVYSRGGNQTIRYNFHNIHRQSAQSNHWQNDDGLLREGIVKEYGQDYMDFISNLRRTPQLKYSNDQLHQITIKARKIALELAKLDLTYSLQNRIKMRNNYNLLLGIYEPEYCVFESKC